jgi:DNA-binding MarR family transcriptional regulator
MFRYVPPSENSNPPALDSEAVISPTPAETGAPGKPVHSEETSVEIVQNVMRAAHRLRAILNTHLGQFELTDIRYSVLQAISETASNGCSQKDLSNRLNQTESSISTLIERMRQSGLLYRLPSTVDRRRKVLLLSELGRETLARAEEFHSRRMAALLTCFNGSERNTFSRLLKVWVDELTRLPADAARAPLPMEIEDLEAASFSFPFGAQQKPAA